LGGRDQPPCVPWGQIACGDPRGSARRVDRVIRQFKITRLLTAPSEQPAASARFGADASVTPAAAAAAHHKAAAASAVYFYY